MKKSLNPGKAKEAAPAGGAAGLIMAAVIGILGVSAGSWWKSNSGKQPFDNSTNKMNSTSNQLASVQVNYGPQTKPPVAEKSAYEAALNALKKNPRDAMAHIGAGQALVEENKTAEAAEHFHAAILIDPKLAAAHLQMGLLHRRQTNLPDALRELEVAVRLDPKNGQAHGNLGYVLFNLRDIDQSIAHFMEALRIDPNDAAAQNGLNEAMRARRQLR